jgi:hypothetical protein
MNLKESSHNLSENFTNAFEGIRVPASVVGIGAIAMSMLSGCGPKADTPLNIESPASMSNTLIEVKRVGVFDDELAYGGKRGVYRITDKQTGKEFIGISGVGISELGSHTQTTSSGKTTTTTTYPDER